MDTKVTPQTVLDFWLGELTPADWYAVNPEVDARIRAQFLPTWERLRDGGKQGWLTGCVGSLAYIVVADQFPRNMFRGEARAFATDDKARAAARMAIAEGWDMVAPEPDRQFFYMPFMHSEETADQALCGRLVAEKMPETGADTLLHARAHERVIRRFGRFPYRNAALGRETHPEEEKFLEEGGYAAALRAARSADALPD